MQVRPQDAKNIYQTMIDSCKSRGKPYRDYKAALRNWIRYRIDDGRITRVSVMAPAGSTLPPQEERASTEMRDKVRKLLEKKGTIFQTKRAQSPSKPRFG